MAYTTVDDIPGIVAGLHETYKSGVTRPLEWRRRQLDAMQRLVDENEQAMVDALKADLHRDRFVSVAAEIWDVLGQIVYMKKNLEKFAKKEKLPTPLTVKPLSFEVWKEPYGVVTVIAPWNFPFNLLLNPVVGAVAAGNTVVVKPSEISTASSKLVAELIPKYFKPSDVAVVTGGVEQTTALLAQKVDTIIYTGGSKVARIVMAAAAKNLTPVILELGGQCPTYVDESANLEVAARRIVYAKNVNCGQVCIAPNHVLVHHKVRDAFLEHVKKEHARMHPGKEQEDESKCRMISAAHFDRVLGLLEGHGGEVVFGGGKADAADKFIPFTVIKDPSPDSPLMQEEIFGPILPVVTVQSVEEAIAHCAANPATPLAAYVFERDPAVEHKWLAEVESGGACVNDCMSQILNKEGGLAGKGESGMGVYKGKYSFESFTHRKVVAFQSPNFDPLAKYPPYQEVPQILKMLVSQQFPAWVRPLYLGVVGAAAASLVMLVNNYVSISTKPERRSVRKMPSYSEYKKLKAKMKKLKKIKRDLQNPGQAIKHKLEPDAYKQAKHKVHQAKNPGQALKHKLQPDAYKKAKRRLKKLSKLKKMLKGEVHSKPRGMMPPEGHGGPRHGAALGGGHGGGGDSSSECSSVSSGSDLSDISDLSDLSSSDDGGYGSS
eukprot:g13163.t1